VRSSALTIFDDLQQTLQLFVWAIYVSCVKELLYSILSNDLLFFSQLYQKSNVIIAVLQLS